MRSYWSRVGPYPNMTYVLIKKGNLERDTNTGHMPCGDWSYAATSQGTSGAIRGWKRDHVKAESRDT